MAVSLLLAAEAFGLQVSVVANPVNPRVNEATTLTTVLTNPPSEGTPAYNWAIDFGGAWFSHGKRPTLSYLSNQPESLGFRGNGQLRHRGVGHLGARHRHLDRGYIGTYRGADAGTAARAHGPEGHGRRRRHRVELDGPIRQRHHQVPGAGERQWGRNLES